jgi:hypothetical protein
VGESTAPICRPSATGSSNAAGAARPTTSVVSSTPAMASRPRL